MKTPPLDAEFVGCQDTFKVHAQTQRKETIKRNKKRNIEKGGITLLRSERKRNLKQRRIPLPLEIMRLPKDKKFKGKKYQAKRTLSTTRISQKGKTRI